MKEAAVRIVGLRKYFGTVRAVDGLDLEIHEGEVFGLLGPNGAGKTTTIKVLLGLTRPSAGAVEVVGLDPTHHPREIRARVGYAMQQLALDLYLTGRENLRVFAELFNLPPRNIGQRVEDVLAWAGLLGSADRLIRTYSGGMRRRLNLAVSLLHRPELFFLDEPTLGLDVHSRRQLWELIEEVRASGTTVVLTTHYLEEANQLCDRVGVMDKGRLVALGSPARLKEDLAGDLHRLTVTFTQRPELEDLDLPVPGWGEGGEVTFSGSQRRLWEVLEMLRDLHGDQIKEISHVQPTLDNVVARLTEAQSEARLGPGGE